MDPTATDPPTSCLTLSLPLRDGECTCKLDASMRDVLVSWLSELDWNSLEEVKHSRVRTVLRGAVPGGPQIHAKLYRAVRLSDRARDALGGSRGVREFDRLAEARERGIPAVRPLAAGRWTGSFGSRSFLITQSVEANAMARRGWSDADAAAAGQLLRRAHDLGLHAADLHPGNLLLGNGAHHWLCDLTSSVVANPLEFEQRARALALFCLELDGLVADACAKPLLEAYAAPAALIDAAQRSARRLRNRALSAFGRRATRECRHTTVDDTESGTRWFLHRPNEALHAAARAWQRPSKNSAVKSGRRGGVWIEPEFVVKERTASTARELFRAAYWLSFAGIPTATPVALRLTHARGHVFMQRLQGPDLASELRSLSPTELRSVAADLGDSIGRLHAFGLRNRDLKLDNLVRDPNSGRIHVVDLDGIRRRLPLERRGQGRDLGRLLAAYRAATDSDPVEPGLLRAFYRSYRAAWRRLGLKPSRNLRRHTEARAREWAAAHRNTSAR